MKYKPVLDMKVKDVELINDIGQFLENYLVDDLLMETLGYNYLSIDCDGEVYLHVDKPKNYDGVWEVIGDNYLNLGMVLSYSIHTKINIANSKHLLFTLGEKEKSNGKIQNR